jgi:predicted DNA binding CopG/RHH family protein
MKRKIRYTDAPKGIQEEMDRSVDVTEWFRENFPQFRPEALAANPPKVKVTLTLGVDSVKYFKAQAKKLKVPYQRMIRNLLERYAAMNR